jgi:hypothetical protein
VTALVASCLWLGYHRKDWKIAKGVCIPKPGKPSYDKVKNFRVISLLSCLGKLIEKVTAILIAEAVETNNALHIGQFGGRRGRSAMDAAAVLVAAIEDAWEKRKITAALTMDVKGAFPTVNRACLLHKMRGVQQDENLVTWVDSFISDRLVEITIAGEAGEAIATNTGLPQGLPVSPILFLIYIADLASLVENRVPGTVGLSFVDDVTWVVDGDNAEEVTTKPMYCASTCLSWVASNAVCFEANKTEAILFSKRRANQVPPDLAVQVDSHRVTYNPNTI